MSDKYTGEYMKEECNKVLKCLDRKCKTTKEISQETGLSEMAVDMCINKLHIANLVNTRNVYSVSVGFI